MTELEIKKSRVVTGIFSETKQAGFAITNLLEAGFEQETMSILGANSEELREVIQQLTKPGPDLTLVGASVIGAIIGAILGAQFLKFVPEADPHLVVVPLLLSLAGTAIGAWIGIIIQEIQYSYTQEPPPVQSKAKHYKRSILVCISVKDSSSRYKAESVLEESCAEEILVAHLIDEPSISSTQG